NRALKVLDGVGGAQGAIQRTAEAERDERKRLVKAFAHRSGSTRVISQLPSQAFEDRLGLLCARSFPPLAHLCPNPLALVLRKMIEHVAQLVKLTALNQRPLPERRPDRLAKPGAAIDHEQPCALDNQPTLD